VIDAPIEFEGVDALLAWLAAHHATETVLWVRIFRKGSGRPSVDWNDCVVAGITWGWIDGQRKSLDAESYLQRMTPRRPASNWSLKNVQHAERLIAEGTMQPPGLAMIEIARTTGRWEAAYAGQADMVIPDDFLTELARSAAAKAMYDTLNRSALFAIYLRVTTAKRPETRQRRIEALVTTLAARNRP